MSAYDNLNIKCKLTGIKKKGYIEELLKTVGLDTVGEKKTKHYSLGMKQRLGIALALVGEPDLLILDEVIGACNTGVFDKDILVDFLRHKPQEMEVVLTGRNPAPELVELADYVSEICKRKHPFEKGIPARTGIER